MSPSAGRARRGPYRSSSRMCRMGKRSSYSFRNTTASCRAESRFTTSCPVCGWLVEAPVGHGEEPQLREWDRAAGLPEVTLEARLERRGERLDRRAIRLNCDEHERQGQNP